MFTTLGHPCVDRNISKRNKRNLDYLIVISVLVSDPSNFLTSENNNADLRASNLKYALVIARKSLPKIPIIEVPFKKVL